jgi:hypothetical protein
MPSDRMRDPVAEAVGARFREVVRNTYGTGRALARAAKIDEKTVSRMINGERIAGGHTMAALMRALPGQMEYVITGLRSPEQAFELVPPVLRRVVRTMQDQPLVMQRLVLRFSRLVASGKSVLQTMLTQAVDGAEAYAQLERTNHDADADARLAPFRKPPATN